MDPEREECERQLGRLKDIELTCSICNDDLKRPRLLDCLHTFCEECIENNLETIRINHGSHKDDNGSVISVPESDGDSSSECDTAKSQVGSCITEYSTLTSNTCSPFKDQPIEDLCVTCRKCRQITLLPDGMVKLLPFNYFACNAIDLALIQNSKKEDIRCPNCDDDAAATSRCVECTTFLCSDCVIAHRRLRLTKEHHILLLDALQYNKRSVHQPVYCGQHKPELLMFFCEVCQVLICKECTILTHRGHKYEGLRDALEQHKLKVLSLMEICEKEKLPPVEKAVDEVQDMAARLHARMVAVKQAVRTRTEECVNRLEKRCDEMLVDIDRVYLEKQKILQCQQDVLEKILSKLHTARDFVDHAFKNGNEAEIFSLLDAMADRIRELNETHLEYKEPDENDVIEHIFEANDTQNIAQNLGKISSTRVFLSNTKVYGPGLKSAKVGLETYFQLDVRDRFGNPCLESEHDGDMRVKIQAPEGFYINNKMINCGKGTYFVRYTPVTKGKHELSVKIRGKQIPNGMHTVRVYEGIDYSKITESFLVFGSLGMKEALFRQPWAVAVNKEGTMYVTDHGNHRVQIFDRLGKYLGEFGSRGSKEGQFLGPTGVIVDSTGIVIVSDWDNHRLQLFSPTGKFIGQFGSQGRDEGQVEHPAGLAIDQNGFVVVTERDNNRIQVFTLDGKSILCFGSRGKGPGQLDSPTHVTVTSNNHYVVSDAGNNRIVVFDSGGLYLKHFGRKGRNEGEFNRPSGIVADKEGYIIVGDFHNHRIQIYDAEHCFHSMFGSEGKCDLQFKFPSGVSLSNEGRLIVADRHNNRIHVF